jgi:hypothetical protein
MFRFYFLLILFAFQSVRADVIGRVASIQGNVSIHSKILGKVLPAKLGEDVSEGDMVEVGPNAHLKIFTEEEIEMNVLAGSQLELTHYDSTEGHRNAVFNLAFGRLRLILSQKYDPNAGGFQVRTPSGVATALGTDFLLEQEQKKSNTKLVIFRGSVQFETVKAKNAVTVKDGESSAIKNQAGPTNPKMVAKEELASLDRETRLDVTAPNTNPPKAEPKRAAPNQKKKRAINL